MVLKGISYSHVGSHPSISSFIFARKRSELFHIRVVTNHVKVDILFDIGSQANMISKKIVKELN